MATSLTPQDRSAPRAVLPPRALLLLAFITVILGAGLLIGYETVPGEWYAALRKPPFTPPNWVFAPVWSVLYVTVAIAGWRIFTGNASNAALGLWTIQLVLSLLWSPVFFRTHRIDLALGVIVVLLIVVISFIAVSWRRDRASVLLMLPYAAWVAFAAVLNLDIWQLN